MIQSKTHSLQSLYCIIQARREQTLTCSWRFSFSGLYARRKTLLSMMQSPCLPAFLMVLGFPKAIARVQRHVQTPPERKGARKGGHFDYG
jgi:hypothetical protein